MSKVREAYYNTKTGFRGKSALKREGIKKVSDADINNFYDTTQSTQVFDKMKAKPKLNPIVADKVNHVMEMDLIDFSKNPDGEFKYMVVCVDDFSKYVYAYPIKLKIGELIAHALDYILEANQKRTKGIPEILLSDAEPGLQVEVMKDIPRRFGVHMEIRAGVHAPVVERIIGVLKARLERYWVATNSKHWMKPLGDFISGYNGIRGSNGFAPKDADKHENDIQWYNAFRDAQILKEIDPAKVSVGDMIRVKLKAFQRKGTQSYYSTNTYKVSKKSGNTLFLEDGDKVRTNDVIVVPDGTDVSGLRRSERIASRPEEARVYQ